MNHLHTFNRFVNESLNNFYIVYDAPCIVYHTTGAVAGAQILQNGFRTGAELNVAERRKAIYFSDKDVNVGMYARNEEGEIYAGQDMMQIPLNIEGLKLLNVNHANNHRLYSNFIVRGELDQLPDCDGSISYLADGRIYEVALKCEVANHVFFKS